MFASIICVKQGILVAKPRLKSYIREHKDLVTAKRVMATEQGRRSRCYQTAPGDAYQMD